MKLSPEDVNLIGQIFVYVLLGAIVIVAIMLALSPHAQRHLQNEEEEKKQSSNWKALLRNLSGAFFWYLVIFERFLNLF